jgi:glycine cleavage system H protein
VICDTPKSHEWVRSGQNSSAEIGISDHAQGALGDLVFVEGRKWAQRARGRRLRGGRIGQGGIRCLQSGQRQGNGQQCGAGSPAELLNPGPYGAGWLFRVQTTSPLEEASLMSAAEYTKFLADEAR